MKKKIIVASVIIIVMGTIFGLCNSIVSSVVYTNSYFYLYLYILIYIVAYGLSFGGFPGFFLVLLYELFTLGITISFLLINFQLKLLVYIIFLCVFRIVVLFCLVLNTFYYCKYVKHLGNYIFKRITISKHNIRLYLKKMTIISIFVLLIIILYSLLNIYAILPFVNRI
jgi:hypothetical protein